MSNIDPQALLAPISEQNISGEDIRLDESPNSDYFTLKDLRNNARAIERKQAQGEPSLSADKEWQEVLKLSTTLLTEKTKDLEVAAWLTEAAVRLDGASGLKTVLMVIDGLLTQYWDQLFPLPDEDGLLTTLAPLTGLNGEENEGSLIGPIRAIEITQGNNKGPYKLWEYQQCIEASKLKDEAALAKKIAQGIPSLSDFQTAVTETTPGFYQELQADVQGCIHYFQSITQQLEAKCATGEAPPSSQILNILQTLDEHIRYALALTNPTPAQPQQAEPETLVTAETSTPEETTTVTPSITTPTHMGRQQAISSLQHISQFFKNAEPHSPIPYLLDRAVRWSNLTLPELIEEMVADGNSRTEISKLTGIKTTKPIETTQTQKSKPKT